MLIDGLKYITEKEIARHYDRSVKWLRKLRYNNKDFPHYKLNGRVLFLQSEVEVWIKARLKRLGR